MTAKPKPEVLAFGSDQALRLAEQALSEDVSIVRLQPAQKPSGDGPDLALADVSFGRSRVVRLLRALGESPDARALPVISCAAPHRAAFIDVRRLTRQYGKRVATEVLRRVVVTRLAGP